MEFLAGIVAFFTTLHWDVLLKIVGIDIILGLDNAIVIALACAALAPELRNKAVVIGTAGAIAARIALLFIGFWLVGLPFVKMLAGIYLLYLAYTMLTDDDHNDPDVKAKPTLMGAATTIILADLMMSLDNVVALVGAAEGTGDHAFGYTVFGILLSIPVIIFASKGLVALIDKFPVIIWLGSALIAFVGAEMLLKEPAIAAVLGDGEHTAVITASIITAAVVGRAAIKQFGKRITA